MTTTRQAKRIIELHQQLNKLLEFKSSYKTGIFMGTLDKNSLELVLTEVRLLQPILDTIIDAREQIIRSELKELGWTGG